MPGQLVSVIAPAYNHEAFVEQALASVAAQSHEQIELIVFDDCSGDGTFSRVERFLARPDIANRFQNIILQKNDANMGAAKTINKGMALSSGDYITILNTDDCYLPERLAKLLAACGNSGKSHAFSNIQLIGANGNAIMWHKFALDFLCLPDRIAASPSIGFPILEENIAFTTGNLFFSRELYEKVGDFIDIRLSHDWDYLIRLLAIEEPEFVPEPLYCYRMHGNNTFNRVTFSEYFDPLVIYRRYFRAVANGNYENRMYPVYAKGPNMERLNLFAAKAGHEPVDLEKLFEDMPEKAVSDIKEAEKA